MTSDHLLSHFEKGKRPQFKVDTKVLAGFISLYAIYKQRQIYILKNKKKSEIDFIKSVTNR
jgi:hypothetical protein